MVDHIYGRTNLLRHVNRPNMFINELVLYYNYLKSEIENFHSPIGEKQKDYFNTFRNNLLNGIEYYFSLANEIEKDSFNFDLMQKYKNNLLNLAI
jgi:hypothetical protein